MPLSGIINYETWFKTRYFARWMRKTELSDEALCSAVVEMAQGLIDADLGVVNGVGPEPWSRPTREIDGFLCMVLKKMTVPTYQMMNWKT